ncbi:MAG: peptidoglycan DD-metalloendopeptidase family protein [Gammaproteobacteria bacterium]|nr:peptidoglycan DD-metalloendopeptidase family protein [Gammaproteobacteria bacterium]
MNIIFVPKKKGQSSAYRLSRGWVWALSFLVLILPVALLGGGYYLGKEDSEPGPWALVESWKHEMSTQRQQIDTATRKAKENVEALSRRLAQLQAHVIRLDALGSRLIEIAELDSGEFDFSVPPAVGGPEESLVEHEPSTPDLVASLNELTIQLENRAQQLDLLETMLMNKNLHDEVMPAGKPIVKGWTSSFFGLRTDPFTGHKEHHKGVDFAGKLGSDIVTVASGVVTWAGHRYGYGLLVEVNHGNGYATRYGHAQEVLVKVGETVKKGQVVALMGSTGRSTGPHVHFEVWRNGDAVDPMEYIRSAKN